jgi:hypothetical protein
VKRLRGFLLDYSILHPSDSYCTLGLNMRVGFFMTKIKKDEKYYHKKAVGQNI